LIRPERYPTPSLGRVITQWQCTPANCGTGWFILDYTYDLAGNITSYTNSQGVTFTQAFNAAGRLTQVTSSLVDAQHPATLATVDPAVGYHPHGAIKKMLLGNGLTETAAYNNRLQPCRMNVNSSGTLVVQCTDPQPSGNVQDFSYGFGHGTADNGNVMSWSAVGATGAQTFSRSYTYDELNRLATMASGTNPCSLSWAYDIWGNRTAQTVTSGTCGMSSLGFNTLNRITNPGFSYDAAGNMIAETGRTYQYDAENRMKTVNNGAIGTYTYDADGRRVRKVAGSTTTDYIYDLAGSVVAEKQGSTWTVGYIYLNGQLTAQYDNTLNPATTLFVHKDHLGSTRLMTRLDRTVYDSLDYLPYGEQVAGDTGSTHKFTGNERDSETGLDYFLARYYSSTLGRFTGADPIFISDQQVANPQLWNLYSYAANNPLRFIDPTGMTSVQLGEESEKQKEQKVKELEEQKKKAQTKEEKKAIDKELKEARKELALVQEGNRVVGAMLNTLDASERGDLELSDFTLTTDPKNDFGAVEFEGGDPTNAVMFTTDKSEQMFVNTQSTVYQEAKMGSSDYTNIGATFIVHEKYHKDNPGPPHGEAWAEQKKVLERIGPVAFKSKELYFAWRAGLERKTKE